VFAFVEAFAIMPNTKEAFRELIESSA